MKIGGRSTKPGSNNESKKSTAKDYSPVLWMNPLDGGERIRAMKAEFTSLGRDCPFYDDRVRSRCLVDPYVIFLPECTGRSFTNGICCPKILQSSDRETIKVETCKHVY